MVEWSCTKEKINERRPYILVEWSCAHKRNKSMTTIIFGRIVVHKRKIKWKRTIYFSRMVVCILLRLKSWRGRGASHHTAFMGKCSTVQFVIFNPWTVPWNWIAFSQNSFVISPGLLHDLIRRENKLLAKEAFISNTIVFLKQ